MPRIGFKHSKEAKEKNRLAHMGKIPWNKGNRCEKKSSGNAEKLCETCQKPFFMFPCEVPTKKYCSKGCYTKSRVGSSGYWLGKKRNEATIKKMSESRRGMKAWNKGLRGFLSGEKHHWFGVSHSGKNSPVWIKDRSKLKRNGDAALDRRSSAYGEWRKRVWLRDIFKCKMANPNCLGRIEAHHILGYTKYPELRYEVNNGITLCHFHHPRKRNDEMRLSPYFQELVGVKVN
jgi:hypothetical protein